MSDRKEMPGAMPADLAESKSDVPDPFEELAYKFAKLSRRYNVKYVCPYCGEEKPSGYEPSEWAHCGEVGHAIEDNTEESK
jgi:hypothetical protein